MVRARLILQGWAPHRNTQRRKITAALWANRERDWPGTRRGQAGSRQRAADTASSRQGWHQVFLLLLPGQARWGPGEAGEPGPQGPGG